MRRSLLVSALLCTSLVAWWSGRHVERWLSRSVWDHWDVVKPGILYRSGQLGAEQLAAAAQRYGIRTIVNLQLPPHGVAEERAIAQKLGIDFVNYPMPGNGFGLESQFREILQIIDDPARRPVLVHCARGTCRTGAAVALYRLERDGWTIEDVQAELERQTYRQGWIAGYVYQMLPPERRPDWVTASKLGATAPRADATQPEPQTQQALREEPFHVH
jgi:protein tyrosine phosphatase (PTP) superfamily phosphohydrolase (DUF442 family)